MSAQPIAVMPTTPGALLDALEAQGVGVGLRDGRLRLDAPRGVLTPEVRAAVTAQQAALVALLTVVQPPSLIPRASASVRAESPDAILLHLLHELLVAAPGWGLGVRRLPSGASAPGTRESCDQDRGRGLTVTVRYE